MGYIRHKTLVVTGYTDEVYESLSLLNNGSYINLPKLVSPVVKGLVNFTWSYFMAPDGSKEGWETSNITDKELEHFIETVVKELGLDFVLIEFGGDEPEFTHVIDYNQKETL